MQQPPKPHSLPSAASLALSVAPVPLHHVVTPPIQWILRSSLPLIEIIPSSRLPEFPDQLRAMTTLIIIRVYQSLTPEQPIEHVAIPVADNLTNRCRTDPSSLHDPLGSSSYSCNHCSCNSPTKLHSSPNMLNIKSSLFFPTPFLRRW